MTAAVDVSCTVTSVLKELPDGNFTQVCDDAKRFGYKLDRVPSGTDDASSLSFPRSRRPDSASFLRVLMEGGRSRFGLGRTTGAAAQTVEAEPFRGR